MAVPVASRVRRALPDAFIAWAVDPRCQAVLDWRELGDQRPLLDLKFDIPWETWKRDRTGSLAHIRHYLKLRAYRFDLAIDLQGHSKTAICLRLCGAKRRLAARAIDGFARVLNPLAPAGQAVHTVERNLETLAAAFESQADASPIMPRLPQVVLPENLATIAVGSGHPKKNYARWGDVACELDRRGMEVAFLGGPGEDAPCEVGLNMVGRLDLDQTMAWVAGSRVHLAADTGSGHIAAAYGTPVVSVFGWTRPEVFRPYTDRAVVLDAGKEMTGVDPAQIVEAACAF